MYAFYVSKHSDIINQYPSTNSISRYWSRNGYKLIIHFETADSYLRKLHDIVLDGEDLLDKRSSDSHPENGIALRPALRSADRNGNEDANACSSLNFSMILKKVLKDDQDDQIYVFSFILIPFLFLDLFCYLSFSLYFVFLFPVD